MELNQETLKQAKQDLEDICKKYEITLMPVVVHQGDRTFSSIEIVARKALQQQAPEASVAAE
jgi:hypothetical protein